MSSPAKPKKAPAKPKAAQQTAPREAGELEAAVAVDSDDVEVFEAVPQPGYFGFSPRELGILGVGVVTLIATVLYPHHSFWVLLVSWVLMLGLPIAAVTLIALRRWVPSGVARVGSLSIDQFASVAFSVAALAWLSPFIASMVSGSVPHAATWIGLLASIAGVVLTVGAPHITGLRDDFVGRADALANVVAAPARPIITVPKPVVDPADEDIVTGDEALEELEEDFDDEPPAAPTKTES